MSQDEGKVQFTREELFNLVWSTPRLELSKRFGISDVGLTKICRNHNIPLPARGHWAKKAVGKSPLPPSLPANADPEKDSIVLSLRKADPLVNYDSDIAGMLERLSRFSKIVVPDRLANPHPLIQRTKEFLATTQGDNSYQQPGQDHREIAANKLPLYISVDADQLPRALRIFDTLIKHIELLGGRVEIRKGPRWHAFHQGKTQVILAGEEAVSLRIRQIGSYNYRATAKGTDSKLFESGRLVIDGDFKGFTITFGRDTNRKLEAKLDRVMVALVQQAAKARSWRKRDEERERNDADQKLRQAELKAKQEKEQKKLDQLFDYVKNWQKSCQIREFLQAVRQQNRQKGVVIDESSKLGAWLIWADFQADQLDPLVSPKPAPPTET